MDKTLVIEIPYGGMGDHLFHSHLPRIAKEFGGYNKVFVSNNSIYRHPDNKELIWAMNPHVDGFVDEPGVSIDIKRIVKAVENGTIEKNLLDEIMLHFGLDDNKRWHEPEIYYEPKVNSLYQKKIFDPNYLSCVGAVNSAYMMQFLEKKEINFDAVMRLRNEFALYEASGKEEFIDTPTLLEFCDLIHSCTKLYCLTSGTATLAAALGKPAVVFYGDKQSAAYRHSKQHEYVLVERSALNKALDTIKVPYRLMRGKFKK